MKLFFLKIKYFMYFVLGLITPNKYILRKRLLIGGMIIGLLTISSCQVLMPRTCYKQVDTPPDPETPESNETLTE